MRLFKLICLVLAIFMAQNIQAQCLTKHSGFELPSIPVQLTRDDIKNSLEPIFAPTFITDQNPLLFSSIGAVTVADFKAKTWNSDWLNGTGPDGDWSASSWDNFYLVDMVPGMADQVIWIQKVEVKATTPYHFKVDLVNLGDPATSGTGRLDPDVAVRVYDARSSLRELGRWTMPETTPLPGNLSGMEWEEKEIDEIYFTPFTTTENGVEKQYAFIVFVGFDAELIGCDLGIDNVCLTEIAMASQTDLSANNHCSGENLVATFNSGLGTLQRWYVDGKVMKNSGGTDIATNTLDIGAHSNLDPFGVGEHVIKVEYIDGSSNAQVLYQKFEVYPYENVNAFLEYSISGSTVTLDDSHSGEEVKFYRYASAANAAKDNDGDGKEDGTSNIIGTPITSPFQINMTGLTEYYFCKFVRYSCGSNTEWAKDCKMICPSYPDVFDLTEHSLTYNTTTDKYDMEFHLTNPQHLTDLHWDFDDNTTSSSTGPFTSTLIKAHTFDGPGSYEVCVVGEWFEECTMVQCVDVVICDPIPTAGLLDQTVCPGVVPNVMDADPASSDIAITTYEWLLSLDGSEKDPELVSSTSTYTPLAEQFSESGTYTVSLVKTAGCNSTTETATITVEEKLIFGINAPSQKINGFIAKISAGREKQNMNEEYKWYIDYNDGNGYVSVFGDTDFPGDHDFSSYGAGQYKIKLEINLDKTDPNSCVHTMERLICIAALPKDCCNCTP